MPLLTEAQRNRLYSLHGLSPDEYDLDETTRSFVPRATFSEPSTDAETSVVLQQKPEVKAAPSLAESVARSAAESALPTAASIGLGAGTLAASSWLGGPVTGIPITALTLAAGALGGIGASALQRKVVPQNIQEAVFTRPEDLAAHPVGSALGGFVPSLAAFNPVTGLRDLPALGRAITKIPAAIGPVGRGAMTLAEEQALLNAGLNTIPQAAISGYEQATSGQPFDVGRLLAETLPGVAFTRPTRLGKAMGFQDPIAEQAAIVPPADSAPATPANIPARNPSVPLPTMEGVQSGILPRGVAIAGGEVIPAGSIKKTPRPYPEGVEPLSKAPNTDDTIAGTVTPTKSAVASAEVMEKAATTPEQKRVDYETSLREKAKQDAEEVYRKAYEEAAASKLVGTEVARPEQRPKPRLTTEEGKEIYPDYTGVTEQDNTTVAREPLSEAEQIQQDFDSGRRSQEDSDIKSLVQQEMDKLSPEQQRELTQHLRDLARRRGFKVTESKDVVSAEGKKLAGEFDPATRSIRLSQEKVGLETLPHEGAGHGFLNDLLRSSAKGDNELGLRALEAYSVEGKKFATPQDWFDYVRTNPEEAYRARNAVEETLAREIGFEGLTQAKTKLYGTKRERMKQWLAGAKSRWKKEFGLATQEDLRRHMVQRYRGDAPYGTRPELVATSGQGGAGKVVTTQEAKEMQREGEEVGNAPAKAKASEEGEITPSPRSDYEQYQEVQKKIREKITAGDYESEDFQKLWKENETIKNRNGGMPPKGPASGEARASEEGEIAARKQTETPEFKKWFGDSKVVDKEGKPLVVYHGTTQDFTEFRPDSHFGTFNQANRILQYQKESGRNLKPAYLNINNPKRVQDVQDNNWKAEVDQAKREGHDGIVYRNNREADAPEQELAALRSLRSSMEYELTKQTGKGLFQFYNDILFEGKATEEQIELARKIGKIANKQSELATRQADSYIAFRPEQIKSAIGNRGTFDPTNPDIRYSEDSEIQYKKDVTKYPTSYSFNRFLTSRFDRVGEKINTPTAHEVTYKLQQANSERDLLEGRVGNRLMAQTKGYTPEEIGRVYQYRHAIDNDFPAPYSLTPNEEKLKTSLDKVYKEIGQLSKDAGLKIKAGEHFREMKLREEGYQQNTLSSKVADAWAESKPEAAAYDAAFIAHAEKKGLTKDQATSLLEEYKHAIGNAGITPDVKFGALRKVEGIGLPWELVEQNFNVAARRYGQRVAGDIAFFKYLQNDPRMLKALGIKDQYGKKWNESDLLKDTPKGADDIQYIGSSPEVKAALRSIYGVDLPLNPVAQSLARAVGANIMQTGTAIRNILQLPTSIAPYYGVNLRTTMSAVAKMHERTARAFENNAIKSSYKDFDAAGQFEGNPNKFVQAVDKYVSFMRKYTGRDLSDKTEGLFTYSLGEELATNWFAQAKAGDIKARAMLNRFGTTVEGGVKKKFLDRGTEITSDDIQRVAKSFVDVARGTYSAGGLPSSAIEGPLAPFLSLSRWSIERSNNFWKDAILPIRERGDWMPLLKTSFSALLTGAAIEQLNEALSNKRGVEPTLNESLKAGDKGDILAKAIGLAQLGALGGIISDSIKFGSNLAQGKETKFSSPISFPLASVAEDLAQKTSFAVEAIREGEEPFEVLGEYMKEIVRTQSQNSRYVMSQLGEEAERKEKFRDLRVFKEMTGRPTSAGGEANPFLNLQGKKFKKEEDLEKSEGMLPEAINGIIAKAGGDYEKLKKGLLGLKLNSYQTFPSPDNAPQTAADYYKFLVKTQGKEAADKRIADFMEVGAKNKIKARMVPSI